MLWATSCRRNNSFILRIVGLWCHLFPIIIFKCRYCLLFNNDKLLGACGYIYNEKLKTATDLF